MITPCYVAASAIYLVGLSLTVVVNRWRARVSLGHGEDKQLGRWIRVHGNFCEYVPMVLLLMLCLEWQQVHPAILHASGTAMLIGRVLHAYAITHGKLRPRQVGVGLTFCILLILSGLVFRGCFV